MKKQLVVVTGGSGFIAIHIILQLLQQGYAVKTTIRSQAKEAVVKEMLTNGGITDFTDLSFSQADLTSDANWEETMTGATYVIHVASPTPKLNFKDESEMIRPAVDGVLRVLKAARDNGVKRVIMTSAYGAIFAGQKIERHLTPKKIGPIWMPKIFTLIKNPKRCQKWQLGTLSRRTAKDWNLRQSIL